jgi:hypothetical protein
MGYRVIKRAFLIAAGFSFLGLPALWLISRINPVPLNYSVVALTLGVTVGLGSIYFQTKKVLKDIESKGVSTGYEPPSWIYWVFLAAVICFGIIIYLDLSKLFALPNYALSLFMNFGVPVYVFYSLGELVLYWGWERKNKRILLRESNKTYPYPDILTK